MKTKREINRSDFKLIFYMFVHSKLEDLCDGNKEISVKQAQQYLNQAHRLPKNLTPIVIKELMNMGLIEKVNKVTIKVVWGKSRMLDNISQLYHENGLW